MNISYIIRAMLEFYITVMIAFNDVLRYVIYILWKYKITRKWYNKPILSLLYTCLFPKYIKNGTYKVKFQSNNNNVYKDKYIWALILLVFYQKDTNTLSYTDIQYIFYDINVIIINSRYKTYRIDLIKKNLYERDLGDISYIKSHILFNTIELILD